MWNRKMIDEKKALLDKLRPFPPNTLRSLQEKVTLEWTYHSNSIEGNTLTLKETKVVLEGITIGGKSVKEHLEVISHSEAIQYLDELVTSKESFNEQQIKDIHSLVLKKIDQQNAGVYRKENVIISGAKHTPPDHILVPNEMKNLITRYQQEWKNLHPLERASLLHIEFIKIHPFVDGNGRTSRLLQNFELIKKGFPPIVIKKENRLSYYEALDKAHTTGEAEDFIKLSSNCLIESLDLYLNTIKKDNINGDTDSSRKIKRSKEKTKAQDRKQNKEQIKTPAQIKTIETTKDQVIEQNKAKDQDKIQKKTATKTQNKTQKQRSFKMNEKEITNNQDKLNLKDQKERSIKNQHIGKNQKDENDNIIKKTKKENKHNKKISSIPRPPFREDESSQVPALQLLQNMGWTYLSPEEALNLRKNNPTNVLLEEILDSQLRKINKINYKSSTYNFKDENIANAIQELKSMPFEGLVITSEKIFELLTLGKSYKENIEGNQRSYDLKYIDWENLENNVYHVTDEYNVETQDANVSHRSPDIVLFINGIPIVIIECKSLRKTNPIEEAISQHIRNQKNGEIPQLFVFSQILIALCPSYPTEENKLRPKYATTGTNNRLWSAWEEQTPFKKELERLINCPLSIEQKEKLFSGRYKPFRKYFEELEKESLEISSQDIILYGLCQPQRVLEFIKKFILYDGGTKKIARYQQYFSVKDTLKRITSGEPNKKRPDGVIWHTQGSGKSLSMVMLAKSILMEHSIKEPKLILVTDRINLDDQIYNTFDNCQVRPKKASSGADLIQLLQSYKSTIIATTIFKFDTVANSKGLLLDSKDIIVLVDEAHRTQYGIANAKVRKVFPNACFIAYTGTPLTKKEKHTMEKFGAFIGKPYTSREALRDENIVHLLYEGRLTPQEIDKNLLDQKFERITKSLTKEQKADLKKKYNSKSHLARTEQRIWMIACDISSHFYKNWKGTGFKGQLATSSISVALKYQEYFKEFEEVSTAVIISQTEDLKEHQNIHEEETLLQKHERKIKETFGDPKRYEKEMISKFNSEEDPDILIVVNKLLTGFDVPRNTILYLDKPLKEHNLLQATARVNRVFENKDFGYVIDYHGNLDDFLKALKHYDNLAQDAQDLDLFDREEIKESIRDLSKEIEKLPQYYSDLVNLFSGIKNKRDLAEYEKKLFEKTDREDFYKKLSLFGNSLHHSLSSADFLTNTNEKQIKIYQDELKFFYNLKNHIRKIYAESVDYRQYEPKIKKILNAHVKAEEIKPIVSPINIYDKAFNLKLEGESDQAKALMIIHSTKKYISTCMEKDSVFYEKLSKLLEETLKNYQEGRLSEAEFLQKAFEFKDQALNRTGDNLPSSLDGKEMAKAFFGILQKVIEQDNPLDEKARDKIAKISLKILEIVKEHRIVDWFKNRDIQNQIKNKIEDYIYEEKDLMGWSLDFDSIDRIMDEIINTAKNHNL